MSKLSRRGMLFGMIKTGAVAAAASLIPGKPAAAQPEVPKLRTRVLNLGGRPLQLPKEPFFKEGDLIFSFNPSRPDFELLGYVDLHPREDLGLPVQRLYQLKYVGESLSAEP